LYGAFKLRGVEEAWFGFLAFNIVLAALVLPLAVLATRGGRFRPLAAAAWLVMWPNALYLVTDLAHLRRPTQDLWLDVACYGGLAALGVWIGAASLQAVLGVLIGSLGRVGAGCVGGVLSGLGGAGVWLGRTGRHNSWDLLVDPTPVLVDLSAVLLSPMAHPTALKFIVVYGLGLGIGTWFLSLSSPGPRAASADLKPSL
jgi:uncharacterized membrane protein